MLPPTFVTWMVRVAIAKIATPDSNFRIRSSSREVARSDNRSVVLSLTRPLIAVFVGMTLRGLAAARHS